jgi:hypothetical protein
MKFLAALFYALAIAGGRGDVLDHLAVGVLVFLGVVCTLLAIERIVQDAVRPVRSAWPIDLDKKTDEVLERFELPRIRSEARLRADLELYREAGEAGLQRIREFKGLP